MKLPIKTAAEALNLPVSTIERWIRQGRIPIQRSGTDVVFSHAALEKWAATHNLPFSPNGDPADDHLPEALESLVLAMQRGKVCHRVAGDDAAAALRSAVDCIDFLAEDIREELLVKLMERERLASTGIGNGIAIPHPRDPLSRPPETPVITTCFLEMPVKFNAIDDQPVFVFFLLISPTVKHHLHLLSRLSYCIRDRAFVSFLNQRPDAVALYSRIAEFEKQLDAL
ncbi:PTS sugar transporter subunit IIA [uncultured Desulfosarcina sp.]|uniref:PTS sugar transporter subunit IIA n=1 Tax=uncultured Desulfosarcina sp. TaxID=218289 RepID=UPI0029C6321E|nr:PTS sugar transporter subunit IIA [uncultured Desulfosarcina sp.]